ncbi:MAG TPA: phosphoribosylaminoimidazolecarboxamide formyltransferase [bacterium]|nr:phosphoribosylaminoimidazolecarboxamide formyltransferase [bacterium]
MIVDLKYGCNPHQKPAQMQLPDPSPLAILNGTPSMINILDALGAWQLARELKLATGLPGAASFKHTSPAGAAIARPLDEAFLASQFLSKEDLSPAAQAYVRARGGDRMCSFGDVAAVSEIVDESLARVLKREVSDLIIAPGYEPRALQSLKEKKKGSFLILQIDPDYEPPALESRQLFGFTLQQKRNDAKIVADLFKSPVTQKKEISAEALETLIVATVALKYTQSNSVCVAYDGQVIGMGAGQQSRVHCTRLACDKADKWFLQQHPKARALAFRPELKRPEMANVVDQYLLWDQLSEPERMQMLAGLQKKPAPITAAEKADWINGFKDVCLSSDAFIPFRDNIDRANRSHVRIIAQAGASLRDADVTAAADEYGMVMFHTGLRLFLH